MGYWSRQRFGLGLGMALAGSCLFAQPALAARLTVTADHIAPGPGGIRFILYRGAEGFRHEDRAFRVLTGRADAAASTVIFADLPAGQYAVMAYHDANANQRLDMRLGMFPKEGWGLSNDPKVMGPPSFAASSFTVTTQDAALTIPMHY